MAMQGELFTQHALAKHCGWSYQRMGSLLQAVQPRKSDPKANGTETRYYHLGDVFDALLVKAGNEDLDAAYERARKDKAQADKTELEVARLKRQMVIWAAVEKAWGQMLSRLRSKLLTLPSKVAPLVQSSDGEYATIAEIVRGGVNDALRELSDDPGVEIVEAPDVFAVAKPAAGTDGERVGGRASEAESRG